MARLPASLPGLLRERGLSVVEQPDWLGRGAGTLRPAVVVVHDDIIGGCPRDVPGIIPNGRPGKPYLPGPLYNLWVECDGTVHVVAGGVSNNAGRGSWAGYTGNSRTIGVCRSHHPDGGPAPARQDSAAAIVCAVLAEIYDIPNGNVCGHKEWTTRKPDPWNRDMDGFRLMVAVGGNDDVTEQDLDLIGLAIKIQGDRAVKAINEQTDQIDRHSVWDMRQRDVPDDEIRRVLGKDRLPAA